MKPIHKPETNRFELSEDGRTAYVEYQIHDGCIDILHTIVPTQLENRGIGSALVKTTYDWGKTQNLKPRGSCRFADAWLARHEEYC